MIRIHLSEPVDGWASLRLFEFVRGDAGKAHELSQQFSSSKQLGGSGNDGCRTFKKNGTREKKTFFGQRYPGEASLGSSRLNAMGEGPWVVYLHYNTNGIGDSACPHTCGDNGSRSSQTTHSHSFKLTLKRKVIKGPCVKLMEALVEVSSDTRFSTREIRVRSLKEGIPPRLLTTAVAWCPWRHTR